MFFDRHNKLIIRDVKMHKKPYLVLAFKQENIIKNNSQNSDGLNLNWL